MTEPQERLVCVEQQPGSRPVLATAARQGLPAGASVCATPVDVLKGYYSDDGAEGVRGLYVEHLFPPSSIMPSALPPAIPTPGDCSWGPRNIYCRCESLWKICRGSG